MTDKVACWISDTWSFLGNTWKSEEGPAAWVLQVPYPALAIITWSPIFRSFTLSPIAITLATPSLPPTAYFSVSCSLKTSKGGLTGYTPWTWLTSAGLIGEAKNSTWTVSGVKAGKG